MIAGFALFAATAAALLLPRALSGLDQRSRWSTVALRTAAACALLLIAWDPEWIWRQTRTRPVEVVALVDRSASMRIADPEPRSDVADRLLERLRSANAERSWIVEEFGSPTRSDLGKAIRGAGMRHDAAALVLVSDGAGNTGPPPEGVAATLGIPVHTISIGSHEGPPDLRIATPRVPDPVPAATPFHAEFSVESHRPEQSGTQLRAEIHWGDSLLASCQISVPEGHSDHRVDLPSLPSGAHELRIEIPVQPSETIAANNSRSVMVRVASTPIAVLVIARAPSPDLASLLRALRADSGFEVRSVVRTSSTQALREGFAVASTAPVSPLDLEGIEVVVLVGSPCPDRLPIEEAVLSRGVGLIAWARDADDHCFPLAEHLPLAFASHGPRSGPDTSPPARLDHPALGAGALPLPDWRALPPPLSGAAATLGSGQLIVGSADEPLVAVAAMGRGRVAALALGGTWRWELSSMRAGRGTARVFWTSLVRWAAARAGGGDFVAAPSQPFAYAGDSLYFEATATDERAARGSPVVRITGPEGDALARFALRAVAAGRYRGGAPGLPPGSYRYTALVDEVAADSGAFVVAAQDRELLEPRARIDVMASIAAASAGIGADAATLADLEALLPEGRREQRVLRSARPGRNPWLLLLAAGLLGAEWWLRRRSALP